MPVLGGKIRPVRERPPSMKYSSGVLRDKMLYKYSLNTVVYKPLPRNERRIKNAPPPRKICPTNGMFKLSPAAI